MAAPPDANQFVKLLIDKRLVTPEEVELCSARKREIETAGKKVSLLQVLVDMGYVTRSQLRRMSGSLDDSLSRPAQQIPGFQILEKLGAGAMATVFKAKQLSLDRIVAIKVLPKRFSDNKEFVERFYKEGRAAAQLNNTNIVQAIDVGEAGGYHYFVMEYIDGKTVYDDLAEGKAYPEKQAIDIVTQIGRALEHAHEKGFVHRDVKPKNIMLTRDGVAKLADMGLARAVSDADAAVAEAGRAYGTPYYISPEQIRGEYQIDQRADIYSLGATFYHMVTGRVPFEGPTPSAVMHKHLKEPLVPPDHLNPALSSGVAEVVEMMMAKDRGKRYRDAHHLLQDLQAIYRGEPPLIARQLYDSAVLEKLADSGETVRLPAQDAAATPAAVEPNWTAIIVLAVILGFSLILNLFLAIKYLG